MLKLDLDEFWDECFKNYQNKLFKIPSYFQRKNALEISQEIPKWLLKIWICEYHLKNFNKNCRMFWSCRDISEEFVTQFLKGLVHKILLSTTWRNLCVSTNKQKYILERTTDDISEKMSCWGNLRKNTK